MNRVEFTFDNASHQALYELIHLDGVEEFYLELRDRDLIREFGLSLKFKRDHEGHLFPPGDSTPRQTALLETILHSIDQTPSEAGSK